MPATCRAPWKKFMHKRAKISGHINQHIPEWWEEQIQTWSREGVEITVYSSIQKTFIKQPRTCQTFTPKCISIVDECNAEVCTTTYTIQDPFGISRGAGGRKGWRILTACTKNKKQNVTNSFLIPEIFLFYIADFICAYPLFIKVTWGAKMHKETHNC